MSNFHTVKFLPDGKSAEVEKGTPIFIAAFKAGIGVSVPCGGRGVCGKCRSIVTPSLPITSQERKYFSPEELEKGWRLICQHKVDFDMNVEVPISSRVLRQVILKEIKGREYKFSPCVRKDSFSFPEISVGEKSLEDKINLSSNFDLYSLRKFSESFKNKKFSFISNSREILEINEESNLLGVSFDVGTTTIVGYLIDLENNKILSTYAITNPQIAYGDDVISRIGFALENEGLRKLQEIVVEALNTVIKGLLKRSKFSKDDIFEVSIAGNSAMLHLLLGIEPYSLSRIPFVSAWKSSQYFPAKEIGLEINKRGWVYILPIIASFVGADTSGVILATEIYNSKGVNMAIDIGTNGEIILSVDGNLTVTSAAAGPALEGARISRGMRSEIGAIDKVEIKEGKVEISVIGGKEPRGICGTGVVDAISELLKIGIIDKSGRLKKRDELKGKIPESLLSRLRDNSFVLFEGEDEILLTQKDIREVQLAKGAIRSGINILLKSKGYSEKDLNELMVAGGFGNYMKKESAIRIGLIPPVDKEKIKLVGNAAGEGSCITLLSLDERKKLEEVVKDIEYIELAKNPRFMEEFTSNMYFPEIDD